MGVRRSGEKTFTYTVPTGKLFIKMRFFNMSHSNWNSIGETVLLRDLGDLSVSLGAAGVPQWPAGRGWVRRIWGGASQVRGRDVRKAGLGGAVHQSTHMSPRRCGDHRKWDFHVASRRPSHSTTDTHLHPALLVGESQTLPDSGRGTRVPPQSGAWIWGLVLKLPKGWNPLEDRGTSAKA